MASGPPFPADVAFLLPGLLCGLRACPSSSPSPTQPLRSGPQRHPSGVGPECQLGPRGLAPNTLPPGLAGRCWEGVHGRVPGPRADLRAVLLPLPQQPGRLPEVSETPLPPARLPGPAQPHPPAASHPAAALPTALPAVGASRSPMSQEEPRRDPLVRSPCHGLSPCWSLPEPLPSLSQHLLGPGFLPAGHPAAQPSPPPGLLPHSWEKELWSRVRPGAS